MVNAADVAELEQRVTVRYTEKCAAEWPIPADPFDPAPWFSGVVDPNIDWADVMKDQPSVPVVATITGHPRTPTTPQFPHEQWITYPNRRYAALLLADRLLDMWDQLDSEQRTNVALLLGIGGRDRIS